jgi:hypothetical protein
LRNTTNRESPLTGRLDNDGDYVSFLLASTLKGLLLNNETSVLKTQPSVSRVYLRATFSSQGLFLSQGGEVVSHVVHTHEIPGAIPGPATRREKRDGERYRPIKLSHFSVSRLFLGQPHGLIPRPSPRVSSPCGCRSSFLCLQTPLTFVLNTQNLGRMETPIRLRRLKEGPRPFTAVIASSTLAGVTGKPTRWWLPDRLIGRGKV